MRGFQVVLVTLFLLGFASPAFSNDFIQQGTNTGPGLLELLKRQKQLVMRAALSEGREAVISVSEVPDTTIAQVSEILQDENVKKSDVVLTTDKEEIIESFVKDTNSPGNHRKLRIIPFGALANVREKAAARFTNYKINAKHTLRYDRIGVTVLAITVGYDTLIWINASSFDGYQKTSMVFLNFIMAATFGLDRDLWGDLNRPIRQKLIDVFDRFIPTDNATVIKSLTSRYLSNMLLGTGVQLVRTGLLSLEHIQDAVMTGSFWMTAAKISSLVTLTTFAWSELYSSIDVEKRPVAKLMMRRFSDMRGVIMCQLASVSMVLQPQIYGNVPIYSYVIHGAIGLVAFLNAHRVISWLENNHVVERVYRRFQTMENYINTGLTALRRQQAEQRAVRTEMRTNGGPAVRSCRSLIAG